MMQTVSCNNKKQNIANCNCTYEPCENKGNCCACISFHRQSGEMPACFFDRETEKTYDRSVGTFIKMYNSKKR